MVKLGEYNIDSLTINVTYNKYGNKYFYSVMKDRKCVLKNRAIVQGTWQVWDGVLYKFDKSLVPTNKPLNISNKATLEFFKAYPASNNQQSVIC